jgi:hypothetical protein
MVDLRHRLREAVEDLAKAKDDEVRHPQVIRRTVQCAPVRGVGAKVVKGLSPGPTARNAPYIVPARVENERSTGGSPSHSSDVGSSIDVFLATHLRAKEQLQLTGGDTRKESG